MFPALLRQFISLNQFSPPISPRVSLINRKRSSRIQYRIIKLYCIGDAQLSNTAPGELLQLKFQRNSFVGK